MNNHTTLRPNHHQSDPGMAWTTVDIAIIADTIINIMQTKCYPEGSKKFRKLFLKGVIAAVVFFLVCLLILMLHYMYRHKGTYHTNEDKGTEFAETTDVATQDNLSLQEAGDNSRKEYFI